MTDLFRTRPPLNSTLDEALFQKQTHFRSIQNPAGVPVRRSAAHKRSKSNGRNSRRIFASPLKRVCRNFHPFKSSIRTTHPSKTFSHGAHFLNVRSYLHPKKNENEILQVGIERSSKNEEMRYALVPISPIPIRLFDRMSTSLSLSISRIRMTKSS